MLIEKKNDKFIFNKIGKTRKKVKEGKIINKILFDKLITFWGSFVSQNNQTIARNDTRGIEGIKPANNEERLAISETATTVIAVIMNLINKYVINFLI